MEKPFCPWRLRAVCCMEACIRQEKIFFSGGRDEGAKGRKPCICKGYRVQRRRGGRFRKAAAHWDGQIVVAKQVKLC